MAARKKYAVLLIPLSRGGDNFFYSTFPPKMVTGVILSGKILSDGLYRSKPPPGQPILEFVDPPENVTRLQNLNI